MARINIDQAGGVASRGEVWKGAWESGAYYSPRDQVGNGGDLFICILAHTSAAGNAPGSGGTWETYWSRQVNNITANQQAALDANTNLNAENPVAVHTDSRFPTAGEKAALAGTSGIPSDTNKYITNDDSRNTNARTPTAHAGVHLSGQSDAITGIENLPTVGQKAALAGSSGTPGDGNRYITRADSILVEQYADITAAKAAAGVDGEICCVQSVETFYRYESAGSAYTADDVYVLTTADGGNTRWIAVAGQYHNLAQLPLNFATLKPIDSTHGGIAFPRATIVSRTNATNLYFASNCYRQGTAWRAFQTGGATLVTLGAAGVFTIETGASVAADSGYTMLTRLSMDINGNFLIGSGAIGARFHIYDNITGATNPVLLVHQDHASNTGIARKVVHDGTGTVDHLERSTTNDATGGVTRRLRSRGGAAGQDADVIWQEFYTGLNDAGTPVEHDFVTLEAGIADASSGTEDGYFKIRTKKAGATTTVLEANSGNLGFLGAVPVAQQAHVADPAGGGTIDAEARSAINSILATLEAFGLHATS